MTPAINFLKKHKIPFTLHEYKVINATDNYGQDVANALNLDHHRLYKTLLVSLNGEPKNLAVCIVPVSGTLNLKAAAKALHVKKSELADPTIAEKTTGYVVGGISPFGQKKKLPTLIDSQALQFETIFASAGKRGLQIEVTPKDLTSILTATVANIAA